MEDVGLCENSAVGGVREGEVGDQPQYLIDQIDVVGAAQHLTQFVRKA